MPELVAGIQPSLLDGRDTPGHDAVAVFHNVWRVATAHSEFIVRTCNGPCASFQSALALSDLERFYREVRDTSAQLGEPLSEGDATVLSMTDANPAKWHLAHTTWFFVTADRGGAHVQRFQATIADAYRMHVQTEFLISPAASDPEVHWVSRARGRLDIE